MKRLLSILSLAILGFASTSCYDDAALWESVNDLDSRVKTLETLCSEMNTNLIALTDIVNAKQKGDYIVSVTPLQEDGEEVGYQIVFKENGVVKLYHGKDGADGEDGEDGKDGDHGNDGHSPELGTKLNEEDGLYYWTIDGNWVYDAENKKIPLITPGATPQLKIEKEKWWVSYNEGYTWEELGAAVSVGIKSVDKTEDALVITMTNGEAITIPVGAAIKVVLGEFDVNALQYGKDVVVPYTIEGAESEVMVFVLNDGDMFDVTLAEESATAGKVTISQVSQANVEKTGKVAILAIAEDGTTVSKAIRLVSGVFYASEENEETYSVSGWGGEIEFAISANRLPEIKSMPEWISYVKTKAITDATLVFNVEENNGEARTGEVVLASGKIECGFTVAQEAKEGDAPFVETLVGAYKMKQIWVYGGTGPEWGSAGWVDVYTKTWWFDSTTGHGIAAEMDNYLEFSLESVNADRTQSTGKCTNWAGANGKNWDCWFHDNKNDDGSYRIADGAKDVNDFYRQIPIGESTWVRDYTVTPNTVTFTAEGKQTVLKLYEKADEASAFVPGYQDSTAETNTRYFPGCFKAGETAKEGMDMTFHATVKGKDNWDTSRNYELDKIYYNPRDIFFDVQKFDSVPEESKTTEGKITPVIPERPQPEEPEVVTSLAGTYKFRDGKTVGGEDKAISAKGLIEQYGNWDPVKASINSMKDDKFVFAATGTDANGNETGTVTFDKGADGATWNYKLLDNMNNNKEYDGTEMYCIFSIEGTTTYVYDATAGTVTLSTDGREYVVDFLAPGTYKYSTKDVIVPAAAAFGLHLDLGYTEARVANYSSTTNGFARHYVWARDHVFMFDKAE